MWKPAVLAMSFSVLACSHDRIENEWLNLRPAEAANSPWQELPSQRVHEVRLEMREEAVRLLASEAARRLDPPDLQRFATDDVSNQPGRRFYLLRAVTTPARNGTYSILTNRRMVAVTYSARSSSTATVKSAVVVDLEDTPDVFTLRYILRDRTNRRSSHINPMQPKLAGEPPSSNTEGAGIREKVTVSSHCTF